jgi:hypothetical protein
MKNKAIARVDRNASSKQNFTSAPKSSLPQGFSADFRRVPLRSSEKFFEPMGTKPAVSVINLQKVKNKLGKYGVEPKRVTAPSKLNPTGSFSLEAPNPTV